MLKKRSNDRFNFEYFGLKENPTADKEICIFSGYWNAVGRNSSKKKLKKR